MLKQLFNSLTNTMIEVNVVNGEALNKVMEIKDMFTTSDGLEINDHEFYSNVWFMVSNKDAKCVKKILSKIDGVISYK